MDRPDIRAINVRALIDLRYEGNQAKFAAAIGKDPTYVSRWFSANHRKGIGEEMARHIENACQLPEDSLDKLSADPADYVERISSGRQVTDAPSTGGDTAAGPSGVPIVGTARLGDRGYYEELAYPPGHGDGWIDYRSRDVNAYALAVKGDSMRPRIRPGEFVVVEPNTAINPGDEVVVKTKDGRSMVKLFSHSRNGMVELRSINEDHPAITLESAEIVYMHFVVAIVKSNLYRPN